MAVFLIDFENVRSDGLAGVERLSKEDRVYIFYSEHANTLTFGLYRSLVKASAEIYTIKAITGAKNALDFQLVSYLGYMINGEPDNTYYIISDDRGFETVAQFWREKKASVDTAKTIAAAIDGMTADKTSEFIRQAISEPEEREFVLKCIRELSTKTGINNRIAKKYGTTRAGEIYKLIKPLLKDKKGD